MGGPGSRKIWLWSWLGFNAVWFAAAAGAAYGLNWPAVAACALYVGALMLARAFVHASVALLALIALAGVVAETVLLAVGVLTYSAHWPLPSIAPLWMGALWVAYACAVETTAPRLRVHPVYIVATALLAPLAYLAGARLGALVVHDPKVSSWLAISLVWFVALTATAMAEFAWQRRGRQ